MNANPPRLTIARVRAALKVLGLTLRHVDGEYRVAWPNDERSAYYTPCLADAYQTAQHMASTPSWSHIVA